jgi:hypothetical protein
MIPVKALAISTSPSPRTKTTLSLSLPPTSRYYGVKISHCLRGSSGDLEELSTRKDPLVLKSIATIEEIRKAYPNATQKLEAKLGALRRWKSINMEDLSVSHQQLVYMLCPKTSFEPTLGQIEFIPGIPSRTVIFYTTLDASSGYILI